MNNTSDDFPHPVPPLAYLRWKENYFFLIMDVEKQLFGMIHLNTEPAFDRIRISANFQIEGKTYLYSNQVAYPKDLALSKTVSDGRVTLTIHRSHEHFSLDVVTDELVGKFDFQKRMPTFDFAQCRYAAPDLVPFKEVMTLGTNLPFNHIQQAVSVTGGLKIRETHHSISVECYGYRDHSWGMRSDNIVLDHTWCGINFPERAFGIMTIHTLVRPTLEGKEGYVVDADGLRPLSKIRIERVRNNDEGLPEKLIHYLEDVYGNKFTIESDLAGRYAQVPLVAESPGGLGAYKIVENFTPSRLRETGDTGVSLIEIGQSLQKRESDE